ncbi:MAG: hypothetical protein J5697_04035 [Clostridia bacterium]|nr:hypothetical protein [Clostridia bacterium]
MEEQKTNGQPVKQNGDKLIDIGKKTFLSVLALLFGLVVLSIILTFVLPKGEFGLNPDGTTDYSAYIPIENASGINIFKGIFSPVLILGTGDGINLIMLSLFLLVISGAFQAMNDCGGIKVFVTRIVRKFGDRKFLLLSVVSLLFMAFGAFLGLFEEMLTLLPIVVILAVSLGYDSFTGFLISIVACGFGFSSAITNPFTVIFASQLIGVNPMAAWWYRIVIFIVMYALLELFIFAHVRKISKSPEKSLTFDRDLKIKDKIFSEEVVPRENKIFTAYTVFFIVALFFTVLCSSLEFLRDYTVVTLIVVFLFGGFICSLIATAGDLKSTAKSFLKGVLSALPSVAFILLASSVKYVLVEGKVLPTIVHAINGAVDSGNVYLVAAILFAIVLVLEFFISSSTAKAVFVMSILSVLSLGISKEMQVLIYTFADGYTNLLFPTSPVLLIGLSMIGVSYFKWLKKSWYLFAITFALVLGFIALGIAVGV